MILTTEQQRRITDAGGTVKAGGAFFWTDVRIVESDLGDEGAFWVTNRCEERLDIDVFDTADEAICYALDLIGHSDPTPGDDEPCTVLQFPRRTRLAAVEHWLQDHAGQAGNAVARAMLSLADLARRADNARKARRNG